MTTQSDDSLQDKYGNIWLWAFGLFFAMLSGAIQALASASPGLGLLSTAVGGFVAATLIGLILALPFWFLTRTPVPMQVVFVFVAILSAFGQFLQLTSNFAERSGARRLSEIQVIWRNELQKVASDGSLKYSDADKHATRLHALVVEKAASISTGRPDAMTEAVLHHLKFRGTAEVRYAAALIEFQRATPTDYVGMMEPGVIEARMSAVKRMTVESRRFQRHLSRRLNHMERSLDKAGVTGKLREDFMDGYRRATAKDFPKAAALCEARAQLGGAMMTYIDFLKARMGSWSLDEDGGLLLENDEDVERGNALVNRVNKGLTIVGKLEAEATSLAEPTPGSGMKHEAVTNE